MLTSIYIVKTNEKQQQQIHTRKNAPNRLGNNIFF